MPYKKGQSGNLNGRPKGSKNKRIMIEEKDLKTGLADPGLTARDRLLIIEKYAQYTYPKMQSTSVDLTATAETAKSLHEQLAELAGENEGNEKS